MISEKYFYFRKKKTCDEGIFHPPYRSNWVHVLWKHFSNYVFTKDMHKNLRNWNNSVRIKVNNFRESVRF